jgi:hypothetical protein
MDRGVRKGEGPRLFRRRDLLVLVLAALALFMTLDVSCREEQQK